MSPAHPRRPPTSVPATRADLPPFAAAQQHSRPRRGPLRRPSFSLGVRQAEKPASTRPIHVYSASAARPAELNPFAAPPPPTKALPGRQSGRLPGPVRGRNLRPDCGRSHDATQPRLGPWGTCLRDPGRPPPVRGPVSGARCKKPETRAKRVADFVRMLRAGTRSRRRRVPVRPDSLNASGRWSRKEPLARWWPRSAGSMRSSSRRFEPQSSTQQHDPRGTAPAVPSPKSLHDSGRFQETGGDRRRLGYAPISVWN